MGIPDVTLNLYVDSNGNGVYDGGDECIASTVTDLDGNFLFSNLPVTDRAGNPIDYLVVVTDSDNVIDGFWHSEGVAEADNNSQNDEGYLITLSSGNPNNTTADMGYYEQAAAVGNFVWEDLNSNGLQDAGEPGIEGVEVTLTITYPNGSEVTVVDSTDANGHYSFPNLLLDESYDGVGVVATPGTGGGEEPYYNISVTTPGGYSTTQVDVNGNADDQIDSDNHAGVQAEPIKGQSNTTQQSDASTELVIAGYDFGFIDANLPVTLVSFEGYERDCKTALTWITGTEENVRFFSIERSEDGDTYTGISIINAIGNSTTEVTYNFYDDTAPRFAYYRLRMVDEDGSFTYSPTIQVNIACDNVFVIDGLFPNPAPTNSTITVDFFTPIKVENARIIIVDMLGRIHFEMEQTFPKGPSALTLDSDRFASGAYTVQVISEGNILATKKFVKIGTE